MGQPAGRGENSPSKRAQREARRDAVIEKLIQGWTVREIAEDLGVTTRTVKRDYDLRFKEWAKDHPATEELFTLQLWQTNHFLRKWWERAEDDPRALDRVTKLLERQAKLLGLDRPVEVDLSGVDLPDTITVNMVPTAVAASVSLPGGLAQDGDDEDEDEDELDDLDRVMDAEGLEDAGEPEDLPPEDDDDDLG